MIETALEKRNRLATEDVDLNEHIADHVAVGAYEASYMLGFQEMPKGYALMLNNDETHFYWLREDGVESVIHWDKWAVYRGAKKDAEINTPN